MDIELSKLQINGKSFFSSKGMYRTIIDFRKDSWEDDIELILSEEEYNIFRTLVRILPKPLKFSFTVQYKELTNIWWKSIPCKVSAVRRVERVEYGWRLKFKINRKII